MNLITVNTAAVPIPHLDQAPLDGGSESPTGIRGLPNPFGIGVDSFTRLGTVLSAFHEFPDRRRDCYALLGHAWSACDGIVKHYDEVGTLLKWATREELDAMMTPDELRRLASKREWFMVYRGCYMHSHEGYSWSLKEEIARTFPYRDRYKQPGMQPILMRAYVRRSDVVLKMDRDEFEIIVHPFKLLLPCGRPMRKPPKGMR